MIRKVLSIIIGYAIFVITSVALFRISGIHPHADPIAWFVILTIVYGAVFSLIAGLITQVIAKARDLNVNYILAFIIAGFATFSMFKSEGHHWTQLLAIFIFSPASILGGRIYLRRKRDK